jgi:poly-gamma-glutamate synthesis protein (capsule biosynthesis protein)
MNKEKSILFLGDVAPYGPYKFNDDSKTVINLECTLTNKGIPAIGKIILGAKENYLESMFNSRLLCVNLANNHILDYGKNGLDSTVGELEKMGVSYFGLNNKNDNNPFFTEFNKIKIAFISAVCETTSPILKHDEINYISPLDDDLIRKVQSARMVADRVVVYVHLGEEQSSYPTRKDILFARRIIDEGADIVIGSHAHAPQAIEKYKEGIIAHNLGNFIMPELKNIPSYFDESGNPRSVFTSRLMLWNRISWGIMINMQTMEFRIRKFIFTSSRVIELPFTPLDRFLKLPGNFQDDSYEIKIKKHKKRRKLQRRITDFIFHPYIPQKFKRKP